MDDSRRMDEHAQDRELQRPLQAAPAESNKDGEGTLHPNASESAIPTEGLSTEEDWRELARRVQQERDPNKVIELVQQLISKFDEDHLRKGLRPPSQAK